MQAVLLARLRQFQDIAIDLQIVGGDLDLGLDAAKLHVVPRKFGQGGDQRVAALVRGLVDLGVGGFDLPATLPHRSSSQEASKPTLSH